MPVIFMERSLLDSLTEADIKEIIDENEGHTKYAKLEGYYEGDHDILRHRKKDSTAPNNRLVNNMAKYITDTSVAYIPARIPEDVAEQVRDQAVRIYSAIGCQGLSRVDFFVTYEDNRVVFNEINTIPGFTDISMYPKLMEYSGVSYPELIRRLIQLAIERAGANG